MQFVSAISGNWGSTVEKRRAKRGAAPSLEDKFLIAVLLILLKMSKKCNLVVLKFPGDILGETIFSKPQVDRKPSLSVPSLGQNIVLGLSAQRLGLHPSIS